MTQITDPRWQFAKALAKRRQRFGYTQADLATAAGVAEGTLAGLETGARWPQMENLIKITAALHTVPSALLKDVGL